MRLSEFDYFLPKELIAQEPVRPRDNSRLMVLNRQQKTIEHDFFYNLGKYLRPGDVLVANDSKVIPARLIGKKESGGRAEILLLKQISDDIWEALVKNCKIGDKILFPYSREYENRKNDGLFGEIVRKTENGVWEIKFNLGNKKLMKVIYRMGKAPTPPYIKRISNLKEYQTIYAKRNGSVAAPTAGFHFTKKLMDKLKKQGIQFEFVTLHVGLGTFQPVKVEEIEKHQMHEEWAEIKPGVAERLNQAKKEKRRIIAVGTTSVRVLESFAVNGELKAGEKWIDLFIYPNYQFKFVEAMITNFHLPKSTLLMLVSAFAGRDFIFRAYQEAIEKKYRFYSFGDAMLIL
ncbi:MAG: tRNA preQ1(34) S-adenosylmethionine ribosyltransferase-isomerase QueA [Patescibacteria group bacterium]